MSGMDFKVDTNNYLGYEFQSWQRQQYALALSKPNLYFENREKIISSIRDNAVKNVYKTLYNILSNGTNLEDQTIIKPPPKYPQQLISQIALEASQTMQEIMERAVELLLPADFKKIAEGRLNEKSRA